MKNHLRALTALAFLCTGTIAGAQNASVEENLTYEKTRAHAEKGRVSLAACTPTPVSLPFSTTGNINSSSCTDSIGLRTDMYAITVSAGETIDITFRSTAFDNFLYMYLNNGTSITTTRTSFYSVTGVSLVTARHTFVTGGTFVVEAGALWSETSGQAWSGPYTLSIATSKVTNTACTASGTTACLLASRFRVAIAYRNQFSNPPGQTGDFAAQRLNPAATNPDTALFGFGNAQNVEVVVRIVDARPFAPRFDIYYGGMTDVEYTVTVTDTQTGQTKQYKNNPGQVGGGVDRASFPAN